MEAEKVTAKPVQQRLLAPPEWTIFDRLHTRQTIPVPANTNTDRNNIRGSQSP